MSSFTARSGSGWSRALMSALAVAVASGAAVGDGGRTQAAHATAHRTRSVTFATRKQWSGKAVGVPASVAANAAHAINAAHTMATRIRSNRTMGPQLAAANGRVTRRALVAAVARKCGSQSPA